MKKFQDRCDKCGKFVEECSLVIDEHNRCICWQCERENIANMPLTAYKIFLSDGSQYVTSMAAGVTIEKARKYFLGTRQENEEETDSLIVIRVEKWEGER